MDDRKLKRRFAEEEVDTNEGAKKQKLTSTVDINETSISQLESVSEREKEKDEFEDKRVLLTNTVRNCKKLTECPYLGSINRIFLDFDFEKSCHVTLSPHNVYCCLVCGKFLEGRGPSSLAYSHSLQENHFLFINLKNAKVFCLPDNYEVEDHSLADIKFNLHPRFTEEELRRIHSTPIHAKSLDGADFIPGLVGLNNVKFTDYVNVTAQLLVAIEPIRIFLGTLNYENRQKPDRIITTLGELVRKIHNPKNFKGIVSPHEFLQAVSTLSNKRFSLLEQSNPFDLLIWLINHLHNKLKIPITNTSIISDCLRGVVGITDVENGSSTNENSENVPKMFQDFWCLQLDVPPVPVFASQVNAQATIPTVPIFDLLTKFDGETISKSKTGHNRKMVLWHLPEYLIIQFKRFSKSEFSAEKNTTVITFPLKNFDLTDFLHPSALDANPVRKYDVVASICHVGKAKEGIYKIHMWSDALNEWFEIEDVRITPTLPQLIVLSESYIQLYRRQTKKNE